MGTDSPQKIVGRGTARRWPIVVGIAGVITLLIAVFLVFGTQILWVGRTDLEIEFRVMDAASGSPINNAEIHIAVEAGGFCDAPAESTYVMTTGQRGAAVDVSHNCMCHGAKNIFYSTYFTSHLPSMNYRASASGYESSQTHWVRSIDNHLVTREGGLAKLTIEIRLNKSTS